MVTRKDQRLKKSEIDQLFTKGKTVRGSFFFCKALPSKALHARLAIVISKNVAKTAVARTTMRRRLKHVIVDILRDKEKIDLVFVLTGSILRVAHQEIKSEIERNIKKFFVHS